MFRRLLQTLAPLFALALAVAGLPATVQAQARVANARIDRVVTAMATLHDVRVRLAWAPGADAGELSLRAALVEAPDLGYRYRALQWQCPLQHADDGGWQCDGTVRSGSAPPLRLAVVFGGDDTDAVLARGHSRLALHRDAATPDDTRIDLVRVPVAWAQALLAQAWEAGRLQQGSLDGSLRIRAAEGRPLQVAGRLDVSGLALETPDASIAAAGIGGSVALDFRSRAGWSAFSVDGELRGGEILMGNTYVALPATPVAIAVDAQRESADAGWDVPAFSWRDGSALVATGNVGLDSLEVPSTTTPTGLFTLVAGKNLTVGKHQRFRGVLLAAGKVLLKGDDAVDGVAIAHGSVLVKKGVTVTALDLAAPALAITTPTEDAIVVATTPIVRATIAEHGSGVDVASVRVTVDGVDRSGAASITPTAIAFTPTAPLADGWEERVPLHQLGPLVVHAVKFGGGYVPAVADVLARYA